MMIRTVLLAVASASALSTAAFAATTSHQLNHPSSREQMSDRCSALESQYNRIIEGKLNTPEADKAEGLHAQGVNDCDINNTDIGTQKLEQAMRELGVKPAAEEPWEIGPVFERGRPAVPNPA